MLFENTEVFNFNGALRGMRNPKESWDKSDSELKFTPNFEKRVMLPFYVIGPKDLQLMQTLIKAGSEHRKFMRQIFVSVDITAPLYWWKEFDTYKVATVSNSCSTMHRLADTPITLDCFECAEMLLPGMVEELEKSRRQYNETKDKIFAYFKLQKNITENILKTGVITDEIPYISENEFKNCKMSLLLSGMFCETDIFYNYNEYTEHLNQTKNFEKKYNNYFIKLSLNRVFNNLQILIHENECVIVSKNKSPAIHFIIHHPKLRNAIENFIPPITEE